MNDEYLTMLVQFHNVLYNKYNPWYKLADKRREAWKEIAKKLGVSGIEIFTKIGDVKNVIFYSTHEVPIKHGQTCGTDIRKKKRMENLPQTKKGAAFVYISYLNVRVICKEYLYSNIKNPLIPSHCPHGYVLKILNALDSKKEDFVDAQNQLMIYLAKQIECPRPIANVYGKYYSVESLNGVHHIVRLLEFIPGKMFHEVPITNYLLYQSGQYLARTVKALKNFQHKAYDTHQSTWQLQAVPKLKDFLYVLNDHARKALVEEIIETFENKVLSQLDTFDTQIIHGDFNEQNIIVTPSANGQDYKVKGIIDFGDTNKSPILFEIGIGLTYMLLQAKNLESGGIFLAGFETVCPINEEVKHYLKYCVAARLAQSLVMGCYTYSIDPKNEYVLVTQEQGWKLIEELWREKLENIDDVWRTTSDKYLQSSEK